MHTLGCMESVDVAVIGAGPAGSATALRLRQAGRRVALIDRAQFPRDKACGEGILPTGVAEIASLGLSDAFAGLEPAAIRGIDFVSGEHRARGDLAGEGAGIDRLRFDAMMVGAARDAGARWIHGEPKCFERDARGRVVRVALRDGRRIECGMVVAADGIRSFARRAAGIAVVRGSDRQGLCTRIETEGAPFDRVEVFVLGAAGEVYLGPSGRQQMSLTWLTTSEVLRNHHAPAIDRLRGIVAAHRSIAKRLDGAALDGAVRSAGPFPQRAVRAGADGVLLVGDAYQSIDPIGGDGITLALVSSAHCADAAEAVLSGSSFETVVDDYAAALAKTSSRRRRFAAVLGSAARHVGSARAIIGALEHAPWLTSRLCALHEGVFAHRARERVAAGR